MHLFYPLLAGMLLALPAHAQTVPVLPADQVRFEAFYQLTYRPDSTAPATRTELMRLQLGGKASRFESLTALRADSALLAQLETSLAQAKAAGTVPTIKMEATYRSGFRGQAIFKVPAAKQVVVTDKIEQLPFTYAEAVPLQWAVAPATATVAGYACQRATTTWGGRTWEAWFTREVPIADGPYKFYGLPGLIVQVADTRHHYSYELAKLRQLAAPVPLALPEDNAKPIAKADFLKAKSDNARSAADRMLANSYVRFNTPEDEANFRQKARERAKRPTNPIELK